MNSIHIQVTKTSGEFGHHLQVSFDGLIWITIKSFKRDADAMTEARDLDTLVRENWRIGKGHVLWRNKA